MEYQYSIDYIKTYRYVIHDAANYYDIPVEALATLVYLEFGGSPPIQDAGALAVRNTAWRFCGSSANALGIEHAKWTSINPVSIDPGTASIMLGYESLPPNNDFIDDSVNLAIMDSLNTPKMNIYLAAGTLGLYRDLHFPNYKADDFSQDEWAHLITQRGYAIQAPINLLQTHPITLKV